MLALAPVPDPIGTPGCTTMKGPDAPCGKDENGETIPPCPKANRADPNEPVRCPETFPNDPKPVKTRFCNNASSLYPETDENCPSCSRRDGTGDQTCKTCRTPSGDGPKDQFTQPDEITDGPTLVAVGVNATYQATGAQGSPCIIWTGGDSPATATGPNYTTKWTAPSTKTITAAGDDGWGQ